MTDEYKEIEQSNGTNWQHPNLRLLIDNTTVSLLINGKSDDTA